MTIHGVGVDLLHVPRMAALVRRRGAGRVASRVLSLPERSTFGRVRSDEQAAQFLGVRYVHSRRVHFKDFE